MLSHSIKKYQTSADGYRILKIIVHTLACETTKGGARAFVYNIWYNSDNIVPLLYYLLVELVSEFSPTVISCHILIRHLSELLFQYYYLLFKIV